MHEERARAASSSGASVDGDTCPDGGSRPHHRRCGPGVEESLSAESAASVRAAAVAIVRHGARYLPVVEDGTLVGILTVQDLGGLDGT